MDAIVGGAVTPGLTDFFIGGGRSQHTAELPGRPISQADIDASNALQDTGWQIDTGVLWAAQKALQSGHDALGINVWQSPPKPERVPEDEFKALDREGRLKVMRAVTEKSGAIKTWRSRVREVASLVEIASRDRGHDAMWLLYGHDSRLRRYARTSGGPNPQGSGLARALLRFDQGQPLGDTGMYWLAVRLAGAAGHDKLKHQERAKWTMDNWGALSACVESPFECDFWWTDGKKRRDDPWAVLATAQEMRRAFDSGSIRTFESHLPVHVDGTCNGLQHLSAMGGDADGAVATNLTSDQDRHDIYAMVAEKVMEFCREFSDSDAVINTKFGDGRMESRMGDLATQWLPLIDRDLVKRGTMTTPYGVTKRGMREQLIEGNYVDAALWGDHKSAAATFLCDAMHTAIGGVVLKARDIMQWLQETAETLAEANTPFDWTTPTGSRIRQAYRPWSTVRPRTAFGRITVSSSVDRSALKPRKQALAAAPNFVHSFDAAHMALTINEGSRRGITHWAMIHDSYGTHAAHMETLNKTLREQFVGIYREDWLQRTYEDIRETAPAVEINRPPQRGAFDIRQVLQSTWFFA
jgi:DNA-directed RNA polymerase